MPAAARTGDPINHGGTITTPPPAAAAAVASVLIGGRPAAVVGSVCACAIPQHLALGPGNVVMPNPAGLTSGMVFIGGLPAARMRDQTTCGGQIAGGDMTVLIGGV